MSQAPRLIKDKSGIYLNKNGEKEIVAYLGWMLWVHFFILYLKAVMWNRFHQRIDWFSLSSVSTWSQFVPKCVWLWSCCITQHLQKSSISLSRFPRLIQSSFLGSPALLFKGNSTYTSTYPQSHFHTNIFGGVLVSVLTYTWGVGSMLSLLPLLHLYQLSVFKLKTL